MKVGDISRVLVSAPEFKDATAISRATVPGSAINEPVFNAVIKQTSDLFPADPGRFIDNLALAFFRMGMLYERAKSKLQ